MRGLKQDALPTPSIIRCTTKVWLNSHWRALAAAAAAGGGHAQAGRCVFKGFLSLHRSLLWHENGDCMRTWGLVREALRVARKQATSNSTAAATAGMGASRPRRKCLWPPCRGLPPMAPSACTRHPADKVYVYSTRSARHPCCNTADIVNVGLRTLPQQCEPLPTVCTVCSARCAHTLPAHWSPRAIHAPNAQSPPLVPSLDTVFSLHHWHSHS